MEKAIELSKCVEMFQRKANSGFDWAFVFHRQTLYYSFFPKLRVQTDGLQDFVPSSVVVKLLQGIFDIKKDHSFFILRNRIYTNIISDPMSLGMTKVVAKKISFEMDIETSFEDLKMESKMFQATQIGEEQAVIFPYEHKEQWLQSASSKQSDVSDKNNFQSIRLRSDQEAFLFLESHISLIPRGQVLHDYHRPIGALLMSQEGAVLGMTTNSNKINKTLHAEVLLMQDYFVRHLNGIPEGAKIYVSHKPCKMCAGMITQMLAELKPPLEIHQGNDARFSHFRNSFEVIYKTEEVGSLSRSTELDRLGLQRKYMSSDSFE